MSRYFARKNYARGQRNRAVETELNKITRGLNKTQLTELEQFAVTYFPKTNALKDKLLKFMQENLESIINLAKVKALHARHMDYGNAIIPAHKEQILGRRLGGSDGRVTGC